MYATDCPSTHGTTRFTGSRRRKPICFYAMVLCVVGFFLLLSVYHRCRYFVFLFFFFSMVEYLLLIRMKVLNSLFSIDRPFRTMIVEWRPCFFYVIVCWTRPTFKDALWPSQFDIAIFVWVEVADREGLILNKWVIFNILNIQTKIKFVMTYGTDSYRFSRTTLFL